MFRIQITSSPLTTMHLGVNYQPVHIVVSYLENGEVIHSFVIGLLSLPSELCLLCDIISKVHGGGQQEGMLPG